MSNMNKFGMRIAALVLCLFVAAMSLSSCGFFVDSYLSDYPDGKITTAESDAELDVTVPADTTVSYPPDVTEPAPEITTDAGVETTAPAPETTEHVPVVTEPPETTAPETTDNIPDELQNHVYLSSVNKGRCGKLVGNVTVTVIVLNDSVSVWDEASLSELYASLADQEKLIESDASGYGKQLDITFSYINASVSGDAAAGEYSDEWVDNASKAAGFASLDETQKTLDNQNGADSNPIVYALNKTGRAYAAQQGSLNRSEYLVLFSSDMSAFRHELYHLYGAEDFYYPELVDELALRYLPDSIMNDGASTDALTAFIIGWDEELDAEAYEFLNQTSHLTQDYLDEENEKQSITGFVTDHKLSYGTYTGYLERGVPTGEGTLTHEDGAIASGSFIGGSLNGYGTYEWPNGDKYSGDWVMGERTGTGTYVWANGDTYTGGFVNGMNTGKGTYTWANGNSYTGDIVESRIEGRGVYTFADGSVYEGDMLDGKFSGNGTMTYTDGAVYSGSWQDGNFHGTGTYKQSDGSVYEGDFVKGVYTGSGSMVYANGNTYVGEWSNNMYHGYGTYTWKDGSSYTGDWFNGIIHGYGKQVYSNGSVYEGEFANGRRNGNGTMNYSDGDVYTGGWSEGNPHGTGTFTFVTGQEYSGAWQNGTMTGYGKMKWSNGATYEGYWVNGKRHGYGKYVSANGKVYEGDWSNDKFQS